MKKATMKKPSSAAKAKRGGNPVLDMLKNMDPDTVAMLKKAFAQEFDASFDMNAPDDAVSLYKEFLRSCASDEPEDGDERSVLLAELLVALTGLSIATNGGDSQAREEIQEIYDLLDEAIEAGAVHPVDLMMTGKIFSDAGLAIPDGMKLAMAKALENPPGEPDAGNTPGAPGETMASSLLALAREAGDNPFTVYEHLNSIMACLPLAACARMMFELVSNDENFACQAIAGFALHADEAVAMAGVDALVAAMAKAPVESSMIERLVRMRPWACQSIQTRIDAAIRAARMNSLPPVKSEAPKLIKNYVSIRDGSGAQSLFVSLRAGSRYGLATVMLKPAGVADAMVLSDLRKSEMDNLVRELKTSMPTVEADSASVSRILALAIADNFASGKPPPFRLVEVVELIGLGAIHPDASTAGEIVAGLLGGLPPEQTDAKATARAHAEVLAHGLADNWFEAGESVEDLLRPVRGTRQRINKMMEVYLPERRQFWARQCAISALVLSFDAKALHSLWRQLALVGRDLAAGAPLNEIPLIKGIAELSVRVFESNH